MSTQGDPALWSASEQAAAIAAREVSSRELLENYLQRIERLNPTLNAVVTLLVEPARIVAAAADEATASGAALPALHGLPVTIKDAIETSGIRSTGGAVELAQHIPLHDATAVARLKAAGAIVFGKTNLPRWSGDGQSYNELFGRTNNPWNRGHTPGGSSGGAAAAVAAGLTSFELGTDIGGSVRMPSSFSGVWGHKPSFGLIPTFGYLDSVGGGTIEADVNVFGPMARSCADLELLLTTMAGPSQERAKAWQLALPPPRHTQLKDFRVAAWLEDPNCPIDDEVAEVLEKAVVALAGTGARVDRAVRPAVDFAEANHLGLQLISIATTVSSSEAEIEALAGQSDGRAISVMRHRTWLEGHRRRTAMRAAWAEFFRDVDILLCPVTPTAAFPHQTEGTWATRTLTVNGAARPYSDLVGWTSLIGMAYLPVTTPPLGLSRSGLPVSVQVVAPFLEDRSALAFAKDLAELCGGGYKVPPGCE